MPSATNKLRVLLIGDAAVAATAIESQLLALGYEAVRHVASGDDALALAERLRPEVVVIEHGASGMSASIETARAIVVRLSLPVVVAVPSADDIADVAVLDLPFDLLSEPWSPRELCGAIETAVSKHQVREAQQRLEERLHAVLLGSKDALWSRDRIRREYYYSPRWIEMLGYAPGELQPGRNLWRELLHPDDAERVTVFLKAAFAGAESHFEVEVRLRHKAGHYLPVLSRAAVVRDAQRRVIRVTGISTDLTPTRQIERELQTQRDFATQIINTAGQGICVTSADSRFEYVNPAFTRSFGWELADLIGRPTESVGVADDQATLAAQRALRRAGETSAYESRIRRADGSIAQVLITAAPHQYEGQFLGSIAIFTDLTERKQVEAELRIAAIAFESQQGMFITDAAWKVLRVNKAFTEITGYSPEEAVGKKRHLLLRPGRHDATFLVAMAEGLEARGSWQGEIWDRRKNGEVFPQWLSVTAVKDEAGVLTHHVHAFTDITVRKAAEDQIQRLAFFDPMTSLPNRRLLMDRLRQAMAASARRQNRGALIFVDLDNFKTLNDTHGHHQGDLLLNQVAQRLTTCVREGDTVARLGGDEFVVMLEDLSEHTLEAAAQAQIVGEKILQTLNSVYQLAEYEHHSTPSIGITLFGGTDEEIEEPLKRADMAMYQAKAAGRNTLRFFDPKMHAIVSARAALEQGLREAVVNQQLVLHYQPQMTRDRQLSGVEALVRWRHPQRGLVLPSEFIPLAEESGLILTLGYWVLESACRQLASWAKRPETAHLKIAVNVSARQFHQIDFVAQVLAILKRSDVNPQRLGLELTESVLVSNVEDVIVKMTALKGQGVSFALDDFGTGYSSLSHLKRLPLDQLKIDQSFVRDVLTDGNDAAIARMVVALAESLGLAVVAEGVETEAQLEFLAALGCQAYQGHLFSHPLPLDQFEAFLTAQRRVD